MRVGNDLCVNGNLWHPISNDGFLVSVVHGVGWGAINPMLLCILCPNLGTP